MTEPASVATVDASTTSSTPATEGPATSAEATTTTDTTATDTTAPGEDDPVAIEWTEVEPGVEEAVFEVPLDHDEPGGASIELRLARHLATDPDARIGTLFVNPGGPGYGASELALFASVIYGDDLLASFDIVGIDPRGTGGSGPSIDCVDDYDPTFGLDTGPDSPAEEAELLAAATEFAAGCLDRSGDVFEHITTVASARDVDLVRRALGEDEVSWFGWSYGTALGATWATLFPDTVRAVVLDGAVDPTVGRVDGLVQQAAGFDASLSTFLAECSADPTCAFHRDGDAEGALVGLLAQIEAAAVPTVAGRPALTQGIVETGIAQALYDDGMWPQLAQALDDAVEGDGAGLLELNDAYFGRTPDGTYGDELEAYFAITCADDPAGADAIDAALAARPRFAAVAPRTSSGSAYEVLICAALAEAGASGGALFEISGDGAGPIVVVGNTGDPATPFEGSRQMADTLDDGRFVAVEANQHTAYGLNACIDGAIERYLIELTLPADDLTC